MQNKLYDKSKTRKGHFFWSFRNVTAKDKTMGYDQKFVQLNEK